MIVVSPGSFGFGFVIGFIDKYIGAPGPIVQFNPNSASCSRIRNLSFSGISD